MIARVYQKKKKTVYLIVERHLQYQIFQRPCLFYILIELIITISVFITLL